MAAVEEPVRLEYLPSSCYETKVPAQQDPFRHQSLANSHNHHSLHPWGANVFTGTKAFDALYAETNNRYMYQLWYTPKLAPFMATEVLAVFPVLGPMLSLFDNVLHSVLETGIDTALKTANGEKLISELQELVDGLGLKVTDRIFVRIGTTSAKDSFAVDVPTTKPTPLEPSGEVLLRRLLTSGRVVGRILALTEEIWPADPGEALIIQRWAPEIELKREIRTFVYEGRVTAISQDIWWEKLGWRERYSDGFVQSIRALWDSVKDLVPFNTCTMDVLVSPPEGASTSWDAKIIEFNSFGAHLNTGSDLFHWINDADILYGRTPGITVRFVDDWEDDKPGQAEEEEKPVETKQEDAEPDWLTLENKLRDLYGKRADEQEKLPTEKAKLPLRGRWCSAY